MENFHLSVKQSYHYASKMARSQAKNFYYGFLFLPPQKRQAISTIYAFMRICDDIVDGPSPLEIKRKELNQWKEKIQNLLRGQDFSHPIFPALHQTLIDFKIPHHYLLELMEGVEMDLTPQRFQTFEELKPYCYKVASIVGLVCLYIFRFNNPQALSCSESCGMAFQLTNILRDLKEDAQMGRVYLPQEDLKKFGYSERDLLNFTDNGAFQKLMRFEAQRAEAFYAQVDTLPQWVEPDSQRALKVMIEIYHGLLKKMGVLEYHVFAQRIRLNFWEKLKILALNFK